GMQVPLLQPVVQDDTQVERLLRAALIYGEAKAGQKSPAALGDERIGAGERILRRAGAWTEIVRPFALTASSVPVAVGGALAGLYLIAQRGWPIILLGLLGLAGGYFYTAPPFEYKFKALGIPLVFLLMGPLMVAGSYYAITGMFDPATVIVSVPVGLLVT